MGNESSKKGSPSRGRGAANSAEAAALEELFRNINAMKPAQLAARWEPVLDRFLMQRVINYIAPKSNPEAIVANKDRFQKFFQQLVRGSVWDGAPVLFEILTGPTPHETITKKTCTDYVESLVRSYTHTYADSGWVSSGSEGKADTSLFAQSLCAELPAESTVDEFTSWMNNTPKVTSLHNAVLSRLDPHETRHEQMHPRCSLAGVASLLSFPAVLFVNASLPADMRTEWRMLYTTRRQGESFSKLLECIVKKGPTLLVVRDKGGGVFGAFAPAPWALGPKFFGDSSSFLFRIRADMSVYSSSGFNGNYQYLNMGQQTMPNGLGLGGTLGYFGLWLDAEFGAGMSGESCTTYRGHRTLSTAKEFKLDTLEVWRVGPEEVVEEEVGKRSVLDSNTEARAMLEMLGKKAHSDGYREPEPGL